MNIRIIGPGLLTALLLAACNNVSSETALFARAAAAEPPLLREGMWGVRKEGCVLSASGRTPDGCTPPIPVSATLVGPEGTGMPYVLAAGDPAVAQLTVRDSAGKTTWYYWAVEPVARDVSGRIIEARVWPVQCGPLRPVAGADAAAGDTDPTAGTPGQSPAPTPAPTPSVEQGGGGGGAEDPPALSKAPGQDPEDGAGDDADEEAVSALFEQLMSSMVTREPYEGLTLTATGCTAARGEPVLAAAVAARDWYVGKLDFYWVGDKGTMIASRPAGARTGR